MQRFFVEPYQIEEEAHRIHINGTDVNHIKNVLRMKCGEDVWISDGGDKEYHCQIEELGEDEVLLHILYAQEPEYELPNKIYLFQGLPKADKMELIIQKAVELGAFSIIPVETKRCVVKLDVKKAATCQRNERNQRNPQRDQAWTVCRYLYRTGGWIRGRRGSKGTGSRCPCDYTWKTNPQN